MAAFLLSTLFSLFLLSAFGFYITRHLKIPSNYAEKLLIGLVVCNTIASYISLFFSINLFVLLSLMGIGLIFSIKVRKELKRFIFSIFKNKYILFSSLPFILVGLIISLGAPEIYDTGLYHIQAIKWIEEFPVVPGLANLHGRFGFNPNIFTFSALTSLYELFQQEIFSINFTLFLILVFYFVNKSYLLFKQQGFSNLFLFYLFIFLMLLQLPNLSSPSPDYSSTAIILFVFARILDISRQKISSEFKNYIPIIILSIYVLTIKLAAIPILILIIYLFVKHFQKMRKSLWILGFLSFIVIPWLARNVILTGWLVYPFPSLDLFSFDWKLSVYSLIHEKDAVTGWARNPGVQYEKAAKMNLINWFPIWWNRLDFALKGSFVISIVFPLIILIGQLTKKIKIDLFTNAVIFSSLFGVIFWFFLAPDWRFGISFILVASMSPLLISQPYRRPSYKAKNVFGLLFFILFVGYLMNNYNPIKVNTYKVLYSNTILVPSRIKIPPDVYFKTYKISGVSINVPTKGDRCFDYNIPCTPYPDTTLIIRGNTLESGFKHVLKEN